MEELIEQYNEIVNKLTSYNDDFIYVVVYLYHRKYNDHSVHNNYWIARQNVHDEDNEGNSGYIYTNNKEFDGTFPFIYLAVDNASDMILQAKREF